MFPTVDLFANTPLQYLWSSGIKIVCRLEIWVPQTLHLFNQREVTIVICPVNSLTSPLALATENKTHNTELAILWVEKQTR